MDTPHVTLDETTANRLTAANGNPVPLFNPAGELIGYYLSPARMGKAVRDELAASGELDKLYPPEEVARIVERSKADTRPRRTMDEVIRLIEGR